jgi:hypothetical protein
VFGFFGSSDCPQIALEAAAVMLLTVSILMTSDFYFRNMTRE